MVELPVSCAPKCRVASQRLLSLVCAVVTAATIFSFAVGGDLFRPIRIRTSLVGEFRRLCPIAASVNPSSRAVAGRRVSSVSGVDDPKTSGWGHATDQLRNKMSVYGGYSGRY